jgi:hypothetical protein
LVNNTTGVACQNANRNFIGFELDETYFNTAKERLQTYDKKHDRFRPGRSRDQRKKNNNLSRIPLAIVTQTGENYRMCFFQSLLCSLGINNA